MVSIAIVNSSSFGRAFPEHARRLRRLGRVRRLQVSQHIEPRRLGRLLKGAEIVIASVNPHYGPAFFEETRPRLRLLARHGIGVNNVDLAAAAKAGVLVSKVPGPVEREAMAEHAVALILACLRRLAPASAAVRQGGWMRRPEFVGGELAGRDVGILGLGNIGSRLARILRRGFGARVYGHDPGRPAAGLRRLGVRPLPLAALLRRCSVVSLNCSLNASSRHLMNAARLRLLPRGAVLVNTARGELVHEGALRAALRSGRLAAYGADVVTGEPIRDRRHPLLREPRALIVPHIGAYTEESLKAMGDKICEDVERVLKGRRPRELARA